jgi:hypothetical protein
MSDEPENKPRKWWIQAGSQTPSSDPASVPDVEADRENPATDPVQPINLPESTAKAPVADAHDQPPALPPEPPHQFVPGPPEDTLEENEPETSAGQSATKDPAAGEPGRANAHAHPPAEGGFHVDDLQLSTPETPVTSPELNAVPRPATAPDQRAPGNAFVEKGAPAPLSGRGLIDLYRHLDSIASAPTDAVGIVVLTRCRNPVRRGQVFNLRQARNLVGCTHKATLHVEGAGVAEHHAVIAFETRDERRGFHLYPLGCIQVNGTPITDRTPLHSGDHLEIYETEMVFLEVLLP